MIRKNNQKRWDMVEYAYQSVPVYRRILEKSGMDLNQILRKQEWRNVPTIEKNQLAICNDSIVSDECLADVALERVIHTHTSGSTGTFLDVYWSKKDLNRALIPLWIDRWKEAGIYPNDRVCQFNTTLAENKEYQIDGAKLIISKQHLFDVHFVDIYRIIVDFSPEWFIIHPAIAISLLEKVERYNLPKLKTIKYVELTGEMVLPGLIEQLEKEWNCVVKKHYGSMEVQTIGYQVKELYKVYEQSTYVEILDDSGNSVEEGKDGNIYVTSLHNKIMPIIKYGIGDIGSLSTVEIDGKTIQYLKLKAARKNDLIYLDEDDAISADILLKPIELINGSYQSVIYQFQAYQTSHQKINLKVVLDDDFGREKFINIYLKIIRNTILGDFEFTFEFNDCLFPKNNGKISWFNCDIK